MKTINHKGVEDLSANFLAGKRLGRQPAEAAQREKE